VVLDLESRGETVLNGGWCSGRNERTGERGDFPSEVVCIVPAMSQPPAEIMVRLD
jgi:myosin-7